MKQVAENRRQNVVITLDKIRFFFQKSFEHAPAPSQRHETKSAPSPLRALSEVEITDFLWNASDSVANRVIAQCEWLAGLDPLP